MMNCMNNLVKCGRVEEMNVYIDHCWDNCNIKNVNCDVLNLMTSSVKRGNVEEMTKNINHLMQNVDVKDVNLNVFPTENEMSTLVKCNRIEEKTENIGNFQQHVKSDAFSIEHTLNISVKCDMLEEMMDNADNFLHVCNIKDVNSDAFSIENQVINSVRCGQIKTMAENIDHFLHKDASSDDYSLENLVSTLVKCGRIEDALQIFYTVPHRTVFTWTTFIRGFTECGRGREALDLYRYMLKEGVEPNAYTFVSLFKACSHLCDLDNGKALHAYAQEKGLDCNIFVGNSLISMYGKCGDIAKAENVFYSLSRRDIVSWNAILSAYLDQCYVEKAIQTYRQIYEEGMEPNDRTFVIALQVCCILKERDDHVSDRENRVCSLELGRAIHSDARRTFSDKKLFVLNAFISMYAKCGTITDVFSMFSASSHVDKVSWNTLISACADHGLEEEALQLYHEMHMKDISPDARTFVITFQACCKVVEKEEYIEENRSCNLCLNLCWALHADALSAGFDLDVYVGTTLVKLYGKCGSSLLAEIAFNRLHEPSIVSWNAMLSAYIDQGKEENSLRLFSHISIVGRTPNEESLIISLQACCRLAEHKNTLINDVQPSKLLPLMSGYAFHAEAQKKGFDSSTSVGNALLNMYGKCGSITCCRKVFDSMFHHDIVSWTTLLMAYVDHGLLEEALDIYNTMTERDILLNEITLVCILQAYSKLGSVEMSMQVHFMAISSGLDQSLLMANTLIDAYGACAQMDDAQAVFNSVLVPTVVSWSTLVVGYSQVGDYVSSIKNFESMLEENITPNEVTIQAIISVFGHTGSVDKCIQCLFQMKDYGLTIDIMHYASVVDLLGRVGDFSKVDDMLSYIEPNLEMWLSLLGACQKHGNVKLGKYAFDHAVSLNPEKAAVYVLMSNIWE